MKQLLFSFLFFYAFILNIDVTYGQQQKDSLQYYFNLATNAKNKSDSEQSFNFFDNQINELKRGNNNLKIVSTLTLIAQIQRNLGLINESEETAVEAIELLDSKNYNTDLSPYKVSLYNHLGILYKENGSFQTSINYYEKVLKLIKDPKKKVTALNNLGNVYREKKKFEFAIKLYKDSYSKSLQFNDKKETARILNNLGKSQSIINNPNAINNLEKALLLREEINYDNGIISSYLSLGNYYKKKGNIPQALIFANKALSLSKSSNKVGQKLAAIELQSDLAYFDNYPEYKTLKDSLQKARRLSRNLYAAIKYDKAKELKKANDYERRFERILMFAAFLALLFIFIYQYQKSKHKKEKILQVYKTETRISEKVHDEVANGLYHVMTKLQSENKTNNDVLDVLEGIYNKTRDISKENSSIDVKASFNELLNDLLLSYKTNDINVVTRNISKISWDSISDIKKTTLHRVLQELMTNMRKHSKASIVVLSFNQTKNKIEINYKDNGVGCKLKKSTGLLNTENRMASINGTITFESQQDDGFKVKIIV